MKFTGKILVIQLALAVQLISAHAESALRSVGGVSFDLAIPKGHCVLDESKTQDARFAHILRTLLKGANNTLIVASVECGRLARLRRGDNGNLTDYSTYYLPDSVLNTTLPGDTKANRKSLCNDMRKQGQSTLAGVKDIVARKAKELKADIAVSSTKYIGVVDEDDHGCYAALLVGVKGADGANILMSSIVTSTVVRSKVLFMAIYSHYVSPDTTREGVQLAKETAAELDISNQ